MLGISDCVRDGIRLAIPQPTEWQRIGNEIDTAFIFARADFVNVHHNCGGTFSHTEFPIPISMRPVHFITVPFSKSF